MSNSVSTIYFRKPIIKLTDLKVEYMVWANCFPSILVEFFYVYCDWKSLKLLCPQLKTTTTVISTTYCVRVIIILSIKSNVVACYNQRFSFVYHFFYFLAKGWELVRGFVWSGRQDSISLLIYNLFWSTDMFWFLNLRFRKMIDKRL
jgi:hypothetical protein